MPSYAVYVRMRTHSHFYLYLPHNFYFFENPLLLLAYFFLSWHMRVFSSAILHIRIWGKQIRFRTSCERAFIFINLDLFVLFFFSNFSKACVHVLHFKYTLLHYHNNKRRACDLFYEMFLKIFVAFDFYLRWLRCIRCSI